MPLLTQSFLQSLDIELDEQTFAAFDDHFEATLQQRVIDTIVSTLTEEQLAQLAALRGQDEALQTWLQHNVPNLSGIIKAEIHILFGDIAESAEHI